jgi:isocitrate dehydrogenase
MVLPEETLDVNEGILGRHQGPTHHARRWRHPQSLNVALRQELDLYKCVNAQCVGSRACLRRMKNPRELIEHGHLPREHRRHLRRHRMGSRHRRRKKVIAFLQQGNGREEDPFSGLTSGIGIKPMSRSKAPNAWCARRVKYAVANNRKQR